MDELSALTAAGHSRTRATEILIERAMSAAAAATTVVFVEGVSDQIAVDVVSARLGHNLREEGVYIVPMGGGRISAVSSGSSGRKGET